MLLHPYANKLEEFKQDIVSDAVQAIADKEASGKEKCAKQDEAAVDTKFPEPLSRPHWSPPT
jgi:hypothetical protein